MYLKLFCFSIAAGDPFCGDIDGVPLGQRGVLPGSTQINRKCFREGESRRAPSAGPMLPVAAVTRRTSRTVPHTYPSSGTCRFVT